MLSVTYGQFNARNELRRSLALAVFSRKLACRAAIFPLFKLCAQVKFLLFQALMNFLHNRKPYIRGSRGVLYFLGLIETVPNRAYIVR